MCNCRYCGKEFMSERSLSSHISGCKEYYLQKDGNLERYYKKFNKVKEFYRNKRKENIAHVDPSRVFLCENCGEEHNGTYGSGRFCSQKCARSFASKQHREETNQKISKSVKEYLSTLSVSPCRCMFCGVEVKSKQGLINHERACKKNPLNIEKKIEYNRTHNYRIGNDELDKSIEFVNLYLETHKRCEICGRTLEEAVDLTSKYCIKRLNVDHDHKTKKFRGVLCPRCNSFLGWYETFKTEIKTYLE